MSLNFKRKAVLLTYHHPKIFKKKFLQSALLY